MENSTANWSGGQYATGDCDDGIGLPEVDQSGNGTNSGSSSGIRYRIVAEAATISISCSPSSEFEASSGGGLAGVQYAATATPIEVDFTDCNGMVDAGGLRHYLQVGAALQSGGLPASNYQWTASGAQPFLSYVIAQNNASATYTSFSVQTTATLTCYFAQRGGGDVTCSVHLSVPGNAQPTSGFNVSPDRKCTVDDPGTGGSNIYFGTTQLIGMPPNAVALTGGMYGMGTEWLFVIGPPPNATEYPSAGYGGDGNWAYLQIVTPDMTVVGNGVTYNMSEDGKTSINGQTGLDGQFPYKVLNPADGGQYAANDNPSIGLSVVAAQTQAANDAFTTYVMYIPPGSGSVYIPMWQWQWQWSGQATLTNGTWAAQDNGSTTMAALTKWGGFPQWTQIIKGPFQWIPQ